MKPNFVALAANIARAYEIAAAGGHTISIIPGQTDTPEQSRQMSSNCKDFCEYYSAVNNFDSDIVVEMHNIGPNDILSALHNKRYETFSDVSKRIDEYKKAPITVELNLRGAVESLLKSAIANLSLSVRQVTSIIAVSKTIAGLAGSNEVKAEHIAEAIQYQSSISQ